jgi:hypothetical protein
VPTVAGKVNTVLSKSCDAGGIARTNCRGNSRAQNCFLHAARLGAVEAGKGWLPHQADAIAELICTRRMPDAG